MTDKMIYIPIHVSGDYEDYVENVVGVYDSKEAALVAAEREATEWNCDQSRGVYDDQIVLRRYPLNRNILSNTWENRMYGPALRDGFEKTLYELDDAGNLVKVEEDER
ncbi:hypothetical protein [Lacticaseibacillus parakribbianus]|uniref:hypothetical protein n=1 Tax=Lacticaseibacillus parakribbianus TaxID=2970927 RepID=UPI0021CAF56F|nr:hypothetical protein [Lacticaseibacillus parakribbianus]